MRLASLSALLLCLLASLVTAWEKEDHELFQLNDAVQLHEGPDTTFYSFLGVSPGASQDEINKAYRRKASRIHPDKAKSSFIANYGKPKKGQKGKVHKKPSQREVNAFYKEADERFKRLSVVASVLRSDRRQRYDYFLKNGFPKWRGTGYYYARYRPGLGTVLIGLFIFGGGVAHWVALRLTYKSQRDFMDSYIRYARRMAWGNDVGIAGIPGIGGSTANTGFESITTGDEQAPNWNRKQKRMQAKEDRKAAKNPKAAKAAREKGISTPTEAEITSGPQGTKKRVVAQNGKILLVDSVGNVYLEEETEDGEVHEFLLDLEEIPKPTFSQTFLVRFPKWAYRKSFGRIFGQGDAPVTEELAADADSPEEAAIKHAAAPNQNGEARKRRLGAR